MTTPEPAEHECSDEPRLTAEEWEYIGVMAPLAKDEEDDG
jgi:hypothetical protein